MGSIYWVHVVLVLCLLMFISSSCQDDLDGAVYIVTLKQAPSAHYNAQRRTKSNRLFTHGTSEILKTPHKARCFLFLIVYHVELTGICLAFVLFWFKLIMFKLKLTGLVSMPRFYCH